MPNLQAKRGTSTQNDVYTGPLGEVTIDTTNKTIRVHDGVLAGGTKQAILNASGQLTYTQLPAAVVSTPTNISPSNGATSVSGVTLQCGSFALSSGLTTLSHTHTQWQVSTISDFSSTVHNSGDNTDLTSHAVTGLAANTLLYWRCRHKDSNGNYSAWSTATSFTTASTSSDDVFSAYNYTGNAAARSIVNGIDLAGSGGLVWFKNRGTTYDHVLQDTVRGLNGSGGHALSTNVTNGNFNASGTITAFNSNGFSINGGAPINENGVAQVAWTFRKAPKFFDVVTYTGSASALVVNHGLGDVPGMIIVKRTDAANNWYVFHRSFANKDQCFAILNATDAFTNVGGNVCYNWTTTSFTLTAGYTSNLTGGTYVAYIFGHDTTSTGLIQCGTYNAASSGSINLGWEPQWILFKNINAVEDWKIVDNARGWPVQNPQPVLVPNTTAAEVNQNWGVIPTATGFNYMAAFNNYIYVAIRRSTKTPTVGTQVFNAIARSGTGAAANVTGVGFAPDLVFAKIRNAALECIGIVDRLRGVSKYFNPTGTDAEGNAASGYDLTSFNPDGFSVGLQGSASNINYPGATLINWCFKRAPGVFDIVAYGTSSAATQTVTHGLGVAPELMLIKSRNNLIRWAVYFGDATKHMWLNQTNAQTTSSAYWGSTAPTASVFTVSTDPEVAWTNYTYAAYLFATKAGISKVGSYTGNGTTLNVDCGFTGGTRFILIKRTDSSGDWYVWDTVRGVPTGNDPHIVLNTGAAEVTLYDSVDYNAYGFSVNQLANTNINVTGATYIYLAFA